MAQRPVFRICDAMPYYRAESVTFQYFGGFAASQQKKCVKSLQDAFRALHPQEKVLEISSRSETELGVQLSAFNLTMRTPDGRICTVETAFQAGKVFENGGPYRDLLGKTSREAKKDPRLKESGKLISFCFSGELFPLEPRTCFYNWLYLSALHQHPELTEPLMEYTAFTDIAFNPQKSINCQAYAAAVYVSLRRNGLVEKALSDPQSFRDIVYGNRNGRPICER